MKDRTYTEKEMKTIREFFARYGSIGGKKSKRTISKEEQDRLQEARARAREKRELEREAEDLRREIRSLEESFERIPSSKKRRLREILGLLKDLWKEKNGRK